MSFVISLDPNDKLDSSNITPEWSKFSEGESEMVFNRTGNAADVRAATADPDLLARCRCVISNWFGMKIDLVTFVCSFWESVAALTGQ